MAKPYNITREQVDYLLSNIEDTSIVRDKLTSWFPKNYNSVKDIVIEITSEQRQELQTAEECLTIGAWYKNRVTGSIFKYMGGFAAMGTTVFGGWGNNNSWGLGDKSVVRYLVLATNEEIRSVLITEVKKRGYVKGNFDCIKNFSSESFDEDYNFTYSNYNDSLYTMPSSMGGLCIYTRGQFAELHSNIQF